jgi:hypothetical protein
MEISQKCTCLLITICQFEYFCDILTGPFMKAFLSVWLQIFNQRVIMHNSAYISNENSSKLSIGAVVVWSYGSWIYNYLCNQCLFTTKVVRSNPVHGEVYSMQQYVIKIVSDLRQVGGFHRVLRFPPPIKLTATI